MSQETTTIKISLETRDKLLALGKKGQSYDDVIAELVKHKEAVA